MNAYCKLSSPKWLHQCLFFCSSLFLLAFFIQPVQAQSLPPLPQYNADVWCFSEKNCKGDKKKVKGWAKCKALGGRSFKVNLVDENCWYLSPKKSQSPKKKTFSFKDLLEWNPEYAEKIKELKSSDEKNDYKRPTKVNIPKTEVNENLENSKVIIAPNFNTEEEEKRKKDGTLKTVPREKKELPPTEEKEGKKKKNNQCDCDDLFAQIVIKKKTAKGWANVPYKTSPTITNSKVANLKRITTGKSNIIIKGAKFGDVYQIDINKLKPTCTGCTKIVCQPVPPKVGGKGIYPIKLKNKSIINAYLGENDQDVKNENWNLKRSPKPKIATGSISLKVGLAAAKANLQQKDKDIYQVLVFKNYCQSKDKRCKKSELCTYRLKFNFTK